MPDQVSGVSGTAIAAIFAGSILAWSGVKGYKVSLVTQDLISGKDPTKDSRIQNQQLSVTASGIFGGLFSSVFGNLLSAGVPGTGGSANLVLSGGSSGRFGSAFAKSVLATIGAPATAANIASMEAWARREGGGGSFNPLNTTYGSPQSGIGGIPGTTFNSVGVMNYPSQSWGVLATAKTLLGGGYSDIVAALRSGRGLCGTAPSGLSRWSGGGYSSVC